eukprot:3923403-Rhodomonas_salina.1
MMAMGSGIGRDVPVSSEDETDFKTPPVDRLSTMLGSYKRRVLTLGSGDGSLEMSIVKQGHTNITVTFFDTREEVLRKYPHAKQHIEYLQSKLSSEKVLFGVDATRLSESNLNLNLGKFDLVLFYFPHTGDPTVSSNQALVRGFLGSVLSVLEEGGEVEMALKTTEPYSKWDILGLVVTRSR